jgi:hypothetical protein
MTLTLGSVANAAGSCDIHDEVVTCKLHDSTDTVQYVGVSRVVSCLCHTCVLFADDPTRIACSGYTWRNTRGESYNPLRGGGATFTSFPATYSTHVGEWQPGVNLYIERAELDVNTFITEGIVESITCDGAFRTCVNGDLCFGVPTRVSLFIPEIPFLRGFMVAWPLMALLYFCMRTYLNQCTRKHYGLYMCVLFTLTVFLSTGLIAINTTVDSYTIAIGVVTGALAGYVACEIAARAGAAGAPATGTTRDVELDMSTSSDSEGDYEDEVEVDRRRGVGAPYQFSAARIVPV